MILENVIENKIDEFGQMRFSEIELRNVRAM